MKTIFVVTAGEYSDYHICSVWTTQGLAETERDRLCAERIAEGIDDNYGLPGVEEHYLDTPDPNDRPLWRVSFNYPWTEGEIMKVALHPRTGRVPENDLEIGKHFGTVFVEAETEDLAIKIAIERWQTAKTRVAGVTP